MLTQLIKPGKALEILKRVEPGNGYEAWRSMTKYYRPEVRGRFLGMLQRILGASFHGGMDEYIDKITQWENE
eukprot:3591527-Alexandrium_andersonii.AAC.1